MQSPARLGGMEGGLSKLLLPEKQPTRPSRLCAGVFPWLVGASPPCFVFSWKVQAPVLAAGLPAAGEGPWHE